ncbi:hypothetical protein GGF31_008292 [Allomyces arbusculus]|nr:hypothetical protein GGF31_008292 [Allomyces arbusculus]
MSAIQGTHAVTDPLVLAAEAVAQSERSMPTDVQADVQSQREDQRRELTAARDHIKALLAAVAKIDFAAMTPVPVPKIETFQVRACAAATGSGGRGHFEIEINGDAVGGRVSKRHSIFRLAANKSDADQLEALLEMMDILSWNPATTVAGVVVAEVINQDLVVDFHYRNHNNLGTLLKHLGKQVAQVPTQKAFAFVAKLHGGDKVVMAECVADEQSVPTKWVAMEF